LLAEKTTFYKNLLKKKTSKLKNKKDTGMMQEVIKGAEIK
jgi:hypothetical protein